MWLATITGAFTYFCKFFSGYRIWKPTKRNKRIRKTKEEILKKVKAVNKMEKIVKSKKCNILLACIQTRLNI